MPSGSTISSAPPKRPAGRTKFRETRHPVFKGVRRRGNRGRWVCEMRDPNNNRSRIWLGTYATPEMAARAHDVAALALRGREACLNFADSAYRLRNFIPSSSSLSGKDIRMAAAKAAEALRLQTDTDDVVGRKETSVVSLLMQAATMEVDDDMFDVVGYYSSMAEGLMVDPPSSQCGLDDDFDCGGDYEPLWSYITSEDQIC